jgi:diguanylate cyclase (GGDEF)-like protein
MQKKAIICVDDDPIMLTSLGEQLTRNLDESYCDVELATSAQDALQLLDDLRTEGFEIPLIISDQRMPGMAGDELLIQIHALYPQILKIMLTGQSSVEAVGKAINLANLYRYIAKPWSEPDLVLTVKEALRSYEQEQQLAHQQLALLKANSELEQSLSLLCATLESTADGILVVDNLSHITNFNQKFVEMWGVVDVITSICNSSQLFDLIQGQLQNPEDFHRNIYQLDQNSALETYSLLNLKNGTFFECYSQAQYLGDKIVGRVWSFQNITERHTAQQIIHHQAHHDFLTGLPNRKHFNEKLVQFINQADLKQESLAVLFIDLDHFKVVNDNLGHALGDQLLQQVVERLLRCCRSDDLIARWGGDEFTMMLPYIHTLKDATIIAQRILNTFQHSFQLEEHRIHVSASVGIALYPEDGLDSVSLLKNADVALYRAKELGRNDYQCYTSTLDSEASQRFILENSLHQALQQNELSVYYQPQVDTVSGIITHMEALVRWKHSELGFISPSIFIPIAEQNGLIIPLGKWVLQTACAQAKTWQNMGLNPITIAVNLSPRQLQHRYLLQTVEETLTLTGLDPAFLELEITESATLQNLELTQSILQSFQSMNIKIALDDFGTGCSSLSHLKQLIFQTLKIDQSFVRDLLTNPHDVAIVQALLTLGRGLNLRLVAEGVETLELKDLLQSLGCENMQGYLFSRPLPPEQATIALMENQVKVFVSDGLG